MRVTVDRDKCIGSGVCSLITSEVFDQGEQDGVVVLLDPLPPAHLHDAVREAVARCPAEVISADDGPVSG